MHASAPAEQAHRLPQAGLDERVHHHRRTPAGRCHGELQVVDRFNARMPYLREGLLGKLGFECEDEARRCLTGRVRDDVQLDRDVLRGFVGAHAQEGTRWGLADNRRPAPRGVRLQPNPG